MKPIFLLTTILAAPLLAGSLRAIDQSVEERLKALEQQVQVLGKENSELKKELGWIDTKVPVLVRPVGKETKLSVGGFLQAQGEFGHAADPRWAGINDRFYFRRARIYVMGGFAENFDFKAEVDLGGNSLNAGTGLLARGNEIYINWRKFPMANVRFGQIKAAYGSEQLAIDTRGVTIERSLSNDRLTESRQVGIGLGNDPLTNKFAYLLVVSNGSGANVSANDNNKFQKSAHVYYTPIATGTDRLMFGVSGLWSEDALVSKPGFGFPLTVFSGQRSAWGVDTLWTHGSWHFFSEYLHSTFQPTGAAEFDADGWQATTAYYFVPGKLQGVLRHEEFDPNTELGGNTIRSWTVGLNYLIKGEDLRLMVDYIYGQVPGSNTDGGRLLTRMQVIF